MDNIINDPIPLDDLNQGEYEHGRDEEGQEEEECCGEEDGESQLVHDVETGDDIKHDNGTARIHCRGGRVHHESEEKRAEDAETQEE